MRLEQVRVMVLERVADERLEHRLVLASTWPRAARGWMIAAGKLKRTEADKAASDASDDRASLGAHVAVVLYVSLDRRV